MRSPRPIFLFFLITRYMYLCVKEDPKFFQPLQKNILGLEKSEVERNLKKFDFFIENQIFLF